MRDDIMQESGRESAGQCVNSRGDGALVAGMDRIQLMYEA